MEMTAKWPIDLDSLALGSIISEQEIASIPGAPKHEHRDFGLFVMALQARIEEHFLSREPPVQVTVCQVKRALQVCTHQDALAVNEQRARKLVKSRKRNLKRIRGIDTGQLNDEQRTRWALLSEVEMRRVLADRRAERDARKVVLSAGHKPPARLEEKKVT